jgi:hypothetical protein
MDDQKRTVVSWSIERARGLELRQDRSRRTGRVTPLYWDKMTALYGPSPTLAWKGMPS